MQITLCEDDGVFHGGVPTMVVLIVKFDNGSTKRLPYPASKPISALYEDLNAIAPQVKTSEISTLQASDMVLIDDEPIKAHKAPEVLVNANEGHSIAVPKAPTFDKSKTIEKEDYVTLIKLDEGRNKDASCDLVLGGEYRVIKVYAAGVTLPGRDDITMIVQGYDVVSDTSDRPERTRVFPHEIQLLRKRIPPPPKERSKVEEILKCPTCNEPNACYLDGQVFKGFCASCKGDIQIKRLIKKCQSDQCGNDVALFESNGKFLGSCNKCKAHMEEKND